MHTPGPWSICEKDGFDGDYVADLSNNLLVVPVSSKLGDPYADARLIAAAPDLLDALKELLSCPAGDYDTTDDYANACKKADAAIAKATGVPA